MISFEIEGFNEIVQEVEKIANSLEIGAIDSKALIRCMDLAKKSVAGQVPVSNDPSKSGRKGSRTGMHSKDDIPAKIKNKKYGKEAIIGWEKSDNSPYFYAKFYEFGTSKMLPQAPFKKIFTRQRKEYDKIFQEEYQKFLDERLGD